MIKQEEINLKIVQKKSNGMLLVCKNCDNNLKELTTVIQSLDNTIFLVNNEY